MIHAQPNGIDSDDKYTMAAYRIPKLKMSIEKLTKDDVLKVIKYPNLFTAEESTFTQKFSEHFSIQLKFLDLLNCLILSLMSIIASPVVHISSILLASWHPLLPLLKSNITPSITNYILFLMTHLKIKSRCFVNQIMWIWTEFLLRC